MGAPLDIAGQRFGRWVAIRLAAKNTGRGRTWLCKCDCGTERAVPAGQLSAGVSTSCGCKRLNDLTGKQFGRYTVIERSANGFSDETKWLCRCACGTEKAVEASALTGGVVVSCGCYLRDAMRTHGASKHALYGTWQKMISRCYDKTDRAYHRYGGRGISVCKAWQDSPVQFIADMGEKPPGAQLDRIDNNGNYSPANCRWATPRQQSNNRRSNRLITFRGKTLSVMAWSRETGIKRTTIAARLQRGWPLEKCFSK